jgi:hypothetical protein
MPGLTNIKFTTVYCENHTEHRGDQLFCLAAKASSTSHGCLSLSNWSLKIMNYNSYTPITIITLQLQFVHPNYNLYTTITIFTLQLQFLNYNYNLYAQITISILQLQFVNSN